MSAREQTAVRPLATPDWTGTLSRTDIITGSMICSSTGWRMALTGTMDGARCIHLTARFASPTFADDAAPWTDEHELAKPHEVQGEGYDCIWTGFIRSTDGRAWAGQMGDRYGGRLDLNGKGQGNGVMSLRAIASKEVRG